MRLLDMSLQVSRTWTRILDNQSLNIRPRTRSWTLSPKRYHLPLARNSSGPNVDIQIPRALSPNPNNRLIFHYSLICIIFQPLVPGKHIYPNKNIKKQKINRSGNFIFVFWALPCTSNNRRRSKATLHLSGRDHRAYAGLSQWPQ